MQNNDIRNKLRFGKMLVKSQEYHICDLWNHSRHAKARYYSRTELKVRKGKYTKSTKSP